MENAEIAQTLDAYAALLDLAGAVEIKANVVNPSGPDQVHLILDVSGFFD